MVHFEGIKEMGWKLQDINKKLACSINNLFEVVLFFSGRHVILSYIIL